MFQAESVREAAFGCDWVGTSIPFQRCLMFIIATANKEFQLTAGKFVPVSNLTMKNVSRINILYYLFMSGIRTRHPSKRTAANPGFRPSGHRGLQIFCIKNKTR